MKAPTVTPMCCGALSLDEGFLVAGAAGVEVEAPSIAYLVEAAETVVVDTGFGPVDVMAERHPEYACRRPPGRSIVGALERRGYAPGDVDAVVLSHLDWDHCYNLEHFDGADVYVQREELNYAADPYPIHADRYEAGATGRDPPWADAELTAIDGEMEICEGVTAFPTPGHTVGHQSVAVETDDGTVVAAADAVPTFENLPDDADDELVAGLAVNDFEWFHSAREVLRRADRVLPGHEWAILDADPDRIG